MSQRNTVLALIAIAIWLLVLRSTALPPDSMPML